MNISQKVLTYDEKTVFRLRELYRGYGYTRYKVSKFEEYDLYAHNKSFLVSDNVLTFTDTNGRLMALKPDVTLSIAKNYRAEDGMQKVYYNENVYRTAKGADGFREIMQAGLECIGRMDTLAVCEVLMLAQKSLSLISETYMLDVSHMGLLEGWLEAADVTGAEADEVLSFVRSKNIPSIRSFCASHGVAVPMCEVLVSLTQIYAPLGEALEALSGLLVGDKMKEAYGELCEVCRMMQAEGMTSRLYLDVTMVGDVNYYNGIVFCGFVDGIAEDVLSGGRYDSLLAKMGKRAGAIGFAVYLNVLERYGASNDGYEVDTVLLYSEADDPFRVAEAARALRAEGVDVRTEKGSDTQTRCRSVCRLTAQGWERVER